MISVQSQNRHWYIHDRYRNNYNTHVRRIDVVIRYIDEAPTAVSHTTTYTDIHEEGIDTRTALVAKDTISQQ